MSRDVLKIYNNLPSDIRDMIDQDLDKHIYEKCHKPNLQICLEHIKQLLYTDLYLTVPLSISHKLATFFGIDSFGWYSVNTILIHVTDYIEKHKLQQSWMSAVIDEDLSAMAGLLPGKHTFLVIYEGIKSLHCRPSIGPVGRYLTCNC
jgi:hypothetical protein